MEDLLNAISEESRRSFSEKKMANYDLAGETGKTLLRKK